ncbi:Cyclin-dependent kinase [Musa troglodytarum]|nr:Cyclin-dependent kinase [Musa troglodytarum]
MLASLGSLLSSLPFLVPPTEKPLPPPPAPFSKPKTDRFPAASIRSSAPLRPPTEVTMPAEKEGLVCSCYPSLALANLFYARGGYYNAQVVVGEDEPEEVLLRRFKREVMKAGVIQECKRRRWFENEQEKKKRKARDAVRRNRKRSAFGIINRKSVSKITRKNQRQRYRKRRKTIGKFLKENFLIARGCLSGGTSVANLRKMAAKYVYSYPKYKFYTLSIHTVTASNHTRLKPSGLRSYPTTSPVQNRKPFSPFPSLSVENLEGLLCIGDLRNPSAGFLIRGGVRFVSIDSALIFCDL